LGIHISKQSQFLWNGITKKNRLKKKD